MMSSPARVLLLVENNPYPLDFRVRREAHTLRDAGCQVTIIAPRDPTQPWAEEVDGIAVYRFPAPPGGSGLLSYGLEFAYATLAMLTTGSGAIATVLGSLAAACECERDGNVPIALDDVRAKIDAVERLVHFS